MTVSFPHNGSYNADVLLAIDGIIDGIFDHGSVTHTDETDQPWWRVDLASLSDSF